MRKVKLITISLVIAVILLGAGYAYWSETLTADVTVTTGELNIRFAEAKLTIEDEYLGGTSGDLIDGRDNAKNIEWEVTNLYPGARFHLDAVIENDGSIPAVIENFTVEHLNSNGNYYGSQNIIIEARIKVGERKKSFRSTLYELEDDIKFYLENGELGDRLEPKESLILDLDFILSEKLRNDDLEDTELQHRITVNYKQHNEP